MEDDKTCATCVWYENFIGACFNRDGYYCGEFMDPEESCNDWEHKEVKD